MNGTYGNNKYKSERRSIIMQCHDCRKKITKETRVEVRTPNKAFVCQECADENYGKCEHCGKLYDSEFIAYSGSVQCCDKCARKISGYTKRGNPIW